jgi:hypothetical protein
VNVTSPLTSMPVKEPECFQYVPLRKQEQEIRLIRLLESEDKGIRCQMHHFPLEHAPHYSALS